MGKCDILSAKLGFDVLVQRIRELEASVAEKQAWIDEAVASCAKKGCATIERRLREALRVREETPGFVDSAE